MQLHQHDRTPVILCLVIMVSVSAFTIDSGMPVLPLVTEAMQADIRFAPLIISVYLAGFAAAQIPVGLIADRVGRLRVIYVGMAIFVAAGVLTVLTSNIGVLLAARFLQGAGASVGPVLSRAVARDISEGSRLVQLMSMMTTALAVSTMLAPVVGSFLGSLWGWEAAFWASPIAGLVVLAMSYKILPETMQPQETDHGMAKQLTTSWKAFIAEGQCVWATLIIACSFGGYMAFVANIASVLRDVYEFGVLAIGPLFALAIIPYLFCANLAQRQVAKVGPRTILRWGVLLFGLSGVILLPMAWLGEAPFPMLWTGISIYMFGVGLMLPSASALVLQPLPQSAGFAASILGTMQIGAGALAATVTGLFYEQTITPLASVLGGAGILSLVLFFMRRGEKPE